MSRLLLAVLLWLAGCTYQGPQDMRLRCVGVECYTVPHGGPL